MTKAPADYAANIKTFVDQGYDVIVTVGFAMGDATTAAAKQYPKVKFIGVDQGVCIDETARATRRSPARAIRRRSCRTTRASSSRRSRSAISPASSPAASRSRASSARSVASTRSRRSSATSTAIATAPRRSGSSPRTSRSAYVSTDITKAFNDPGTGKSIAPADDRPEGRRDLPGRRPVRRRRDRGGLRRAGVIGIGVDVDQAKSLPQSASAS